MMKATSLSGDRIHFVEISLRVLDQLIGSRLA